MTDQWLVILGLAIATFPIRISGYFLAAQLPFTSAWARSFAALPGCLMGLLLAVIIIHGSLTQWIAAAVALGVTLLTRSLALTMLSGIFAVWVLRMYI
jgi:branched-subunit amino acid transport protein